MFPGSIIRTLSRAIGLTLAAWLGTTLCFAAKAGILAFPILDSPLTLRAEATSRRFISAHGRRTLVVGYAAEGLEGWVYPFRIFHDFRVTFRPANSSEAIPASALVREVVVNPESVTRVYSGQDFTVRETVFVPLDLPGFVILYRVQSRAPLNIALSFRPDLDLMWPGGIGGQSAGWDERRNAFILRESSEKFSALVGSPGAVRHSPESSYSEPWQADRRLSLELEIPAGSRGDRFFPLAVSLSFPGHFDGDKNYQKLLEHAHELYAEASDHYRKLASSGVQLETPDESVNLAYAWARIALDQGYVCNAHLGCGLVAGYGPSRDTRRPQYAWFFGGDALVNTFALEAAGDHDLARDAMRFIQKYQKKDTGEVFHEISQSAGLIDWFKGYPYAYRHTDASAMYLVAFRNLYRASGDLDFVRESWGSLRATYEYLVSRTDSSDGLVTVPPGGWGGDETIGEQVVKDVYLESLWARASEVFSGFATLLGERELAGDAHGRAEKARASLDAKFWNPQRNFFYYGFNGRGELLKQELGQPNWGIWMNAFDPAKSELALDRMARAAWESDWGLRSIPSDDPLYAGDSYGHGSVWPLGNGVQALAFFSHHRPLQGFPLWRALMDQSFLNSLGHVTEVFSGDFYRELDVSVPEQMWSSGMVVTSTMRGLLGLEPYAPMGQLEFAPHLPPGWPRVRIRNLRIGRSALNLELEQSLRQIKLRAENSGPPVEIRFSPEVPLASKNARAALNGRGLEVNLRNYPQDAHAEVKFSAAGTAQLVVQFEPGARVWVPPARLQIGDTSRGLRILSSNLQGRTYRAEVEGVPGACSSLSLFTPWQVRRVSGGKVDSRQTDETRFIVSPTPDSCGTGDSYLTWDFQVEFAP